MIRGSSRREAEVRGDEFRGATTTRRSPEPRRFWDKPVQARPELNRFLTRPSSPSNRVARVPSGLENLSSPRSQVRTRSSTPLDQPPRSRLAFARSARPSGQWASPNRRGAPASSSSRWSHRSSLVASPSLTQSSIACLSRSRHRRSDSFRWFMIADDPETPRDERPSQAYRTTLAQIRGSAAARKARIRS